MEKLADWRVEHVLKQAVSAAMDANRNCMMKQTLRA